MYTNYFIYLASLPNNEKFKQLFIIYGIFLILLLICIFFKFLKQKFYKPNKNTIFQKFLKLF